MANWGLDYIDKVMTVVIHSRALKVVCLTTLPAATISDGME